MALQANKTSATTVTFTNPQEIVISHLDDSIKIGDGTQLFTGGQKTAAASLPVVIASNQPAVPVEAPAQATRIDEVSSSVTYIGTAVVGTTAAAASWQIQRLTVSGTETIIEYADGYATFDNVWSNRTSLSYS